MRYLKSLTIMAFAIVTAVGTLFAADEPLEIHGGGRIGVVVNSKLGSTNYGYANNALGTMPNYSETRYMGLSFGKKVTSEGGAWAKVSYYMDYWHGDTDGDLEGANAKGFTWRDRDFHVEFGALDFMPEGAVLWAGLRGYGAGWNGQQDHSLINFGGVGFGIQNLGGLVSIAYMGQDNETEQDNPGANEDVLDLGEGTMHNIILSVSNAMVDIYAAIGYSKGGEVAGEDQDDLTQYYVGGIYHAPVMGINIGLAVSTDGYAKEIYYAILILI